MKKIKIYVLMMLLGSLLGWFVARSFHRKQLKTLYTWSFIKEAIDGFGYLYREQNPIEGSEDFSEKLFIASLKNVESETSNDQIPNRNVLQEAFNYMDKESASDLVKVCRRGLKSMTFSSDEKRDEIIRLLDKIESNISE